MKAEHYIPVHKTDLVELLAAEPGLTDADRAQWRRFADMLSATFHYEFRKTTEDLEEMYAPFDPDRVTVTTRPLTDLEKQEKLDGLFTRLEGLMERANFIRLTKEDLDKATKEVSHWGLSMDVDFNIFEKIEGYYRGAEMGQRFKRRLWRFWIIDKVPVPIYRRLLLALKLKPGPRVPEGIDTKDVWIKLFKDIPRMDMEMLLPGAAMRMPKLTRLKLGGSLLSSVVLIAYNIIRPLLMGAIFGLQFLWGPAIAFFGYGYRQYYGYQSTKTAFALQLTKSLYYQTLGNNLGVLQHLTDEAETQDVREALLSFHALWRHAGPEGWDEKTLDRHIEKALEGWTKTKIDFEVNDGLGKLLRLGLVTQTENGRHVALPIDQALAKLDEAWDNYFAYHNTTNLGMTPKEGKP